MKFKIVGVLYSEKEIEGLAAIAKVVIVGLRAQELSRQVNKLPGRISKSEKFRPT